MAKITVDCRSLKTVCGVAVYTRQLLGSMFRLDDRNRYDLMVWNRGDFPGGHANVGKNVVRLPGTISHAIWKRWRILPYDLFLGQPDIYFSPNFSLPYLRPRVKTVITVHDLAFLRMREIITPKNFEFLKYWVTYSIRRADRIISVSESTKNDIREFFGDAADKTTTILSACDSAFRPITVSATERKALSERYGLPDRYILYHGTLEPRKNLPILLKAYAMAKPRLGGTKLVMSGKKGWLYESIFTTVTELGLVDDVVFPGFIEDGDLPLLYNGCEFFTFISRYEGFGIPLLEAMACGKSVITSDVSSMPEVGAKAAMYFSPADYQGLAGGMLKLHEDAAFRKRQEDASLIRAGEFSWERTARESLAVLAGLGAETGAER
jgi:glycosyltransferase involved in cell wall biosynthesis